MTAKDGERPGRWTSARHGRLRRSSGWANAAKALLTGVLVVALSGISVVAYAAWGLWNDVDTVEMPANEDPSAVGIGSESIEGELTILLVGSDSRQGQSLDDGETGELNDVNLVLHVSADHQNATVMSFPRDLMLPIPSCPGPNGEPEYYSAMQEQQLNTTLSNGGLPCVAATLEELTGLDIPYAGLITFDGVINMSNAIGGVDVCLTQPIEDPMTGLSLPAGDNTLVGGDALQFLRTRYGVGSGGDTSRISNQQIFMSSMVRQLQSAETLSDPFKVYQLAKAGVENMTLSSNMASASFLQEMAATVKDIDLSRINFVQYPTYTHPYSEGRLVADTVNGDLLMEVIKSGQPFEITTKGEGVQDENGVTGEAPAESEAPPEGEAPAETEAPPEGEAPVDPTGPSVDDGPVQLPPGITGQNSAEETCSAGRTIF